MTDKRSMPAKLAMLQEREFINNAAIRARSVIKTLNKTRLLK